MAISERLNPDQLNIHKFQEMPETKKDQSSKIEVGPEMKERILEAFRKLDNSTYSERIDYIAYAKTLWPDENWDNITDEKYAQYVNSIDTSSGLGLALILPRVVMAKPEANLDLSKHLGVLNRYFESLRLYTKSNINSLISFPGVLAAIKIINPNHNIVLSEEEKIGIKEWLNSISKENRESIEAVVQMRLFDPSFKPDLTEDDWAIIFEKQQKYKESSNIILYFQLATYIKILAAHKVEVTAPGVIDIQMYPPTDVNTQTPPIPETRKF